MPEAVGRFVEDGTFTDVARIQKRLVLDYRADVRKYCENLDAARIESVFESVPAQLAKENKKFQYARIAKGARRKDFWGCVEWLRDAGIVNVCQKMSFPELPVKGSSPTRRRSRMPVDRRRDTPNSRANRARGGAGSRACARWP